MGKNRHGGSCRSCGASFWLYFYASTSPSWLLLLQRAQRMHLLGYRTSPPRRIPNASHQTTVWFPVAPFHHTVRFR